MVASKSSSRPISPQLDLLFDVAPVSEEPAAPSVPRKSRVRRTWLVHQLVAEAREIFLQKLAHCERIEFAAWRKSSTWWGRFKRRWAYFLLVRVDPLIARWQYRRMPN